MSHKQSPTLVPTPPVFRCPVCLKELIPSGRKDFPWECPGESPEHHGTFSPGYLAKFQNIKFSPATPAAPDTANPKDLVGDTKPDLTLVPSALNVHVAKVMALGAVKYGRANWRDKHVRYTVYLAAALRHLSQALDRDDTDKESGQPHIAHAAACIGILLDAQALGCLIDDRPKAGPATKLIEQYTEKTP